MLINCVDRWFIVTMFQIVPYDSCFATTCCSVSIRSFYDCLFSSFYLIKTESSSGKHDRNTSADSASSYRSIQNSIYTTRISSGASTDMLSVMGGSVISNSSGTGGGGVGGSSASNTNSHSKVKRVGTTPPKSPLPSHENSHNNSYSANSNTNNLNTLQSAYFPTTYATEHKRLVRMGSRGSLTGIDIDSSAEHEYALSFSVFRAFVCVHNTSTTTSTSTSSSEMYTYFNTSAPPVLRTATLLQYITQAEHFHHGTLQTLFDTICTIYNTTTTTTTAAHTNTASSNKVRTGSPVNSSVASSGQSTPRNPNLNTSMYSIHSTHSVHDDADSTTAVELLQALTLDGSSVETLRHNTTSKATITSTTYTPTIQIPHTLLNTLVTPLLGDIFSLSHYTATLNTLGMYGKLTPLMHISPLFVAYLSHQSSVYLLTEVLTKKLSVFPYQRWLRDTLLSFQDTLTVLISTTSTTSDSAGSGSVDSTNVSRSTSAVHSSDSVPFRHNVTASAERDARDVFNTVYSSNSNMYNTTNTYNLNTTTPSTTTNPTSNTTNTNYTSSIYNSTTNTHSEQPLDVSDDTHAILTLAEEIRASYRREVNLTSTSADVSSGVSVLRTNSVGTELPSYNEFIRYVYLLFCLIFCCINRCV